MYEFIAHFTNMETEMEINRGITIDCTPLDTECMDHQPELLFAWKQAVTRAYELCGDDENLDYLELLGY